MPQHTVLLSAMMRELSAKPGFTEALLSELDKGGRNGPALLTPKLVHRMRELILGKDWHGLDRFPGWTMREINPTVRVVGHFIGKDEVAEGLADPGSNSGPGAHASDAKHPQDSREIGGFIDLGTLAIDLAQTVDLNGPSTLPPYSSEGIVSDLGYDVVRGDGPDPSIAPMHAESARLAELMNRLSLNSFDGAAPVTASIGTLEAHTPEALFDALLATGHTVTVADARYFANFGHFHFRGQDVMMPFWVNTQILVPGTRRPLLVPVSHAEYEWFIRGPEINADLAFYFGIDGKAEFRTMDELNQPWILDRHAHEYHGADAREVTRLTGRMVLAYMHQHIARPSLPFGGYYALGVCQDPVAAIEKKLTGKATLFPNTADARLFDDPRDEEINKLIAAIPKDRAGAAPQAERIFGSLPTDDLSAISIPGLREDLIAVHEAWQRGTLERTGGWIERIALAALVAVAGISLFVFARKRSRRI